MSDGPVTLTADDRATRFWLAAAAAFLIVQIVTLALMGRIPICECGYVRLFEPGVNTAGNSQHSTATMAIGYQGDSILNSAMDTVAMVLGFLFAVRAPVWLTVALAIGFEVATAIVIRDNLTLNVLMLVWPVEAVKAWQAAL